MTSTQVVEIQEVEEKETFTEKYQDILDRFRDSRPTDELERIRIERKVLETLRTAVLSIEETNAKVAEEENAVDLMTRLVGLFSVGASVVTAGAPATLETTTDATSLYHLLVSGGAMGVGIGLTFLLSLYNFYRSTLTHERIKEAEGTFLRWEKYYLSELDKTQKEADRATQELAEYFVTRASRLRVKDITTTAIDVDLAMQMTRCMSHIEYTLGRYRQLIEKGEETLIAIERHVKVLEDQANRQINRSWIGIGVGAVAVIAGIATIVSAGGTVVPIVSAILGLTTIGTSTYVIYLSKDQLTAVRQLKRDILCGKDQLDAHKEHMKSFQEFLMKELDKADGYVTQAEQEATLLAKVEAMKRENADLRRRMEPLCESLDGSDESSAIRQVLRQYKLETYFEAVIQSGIKTVDELDLIDEEMVAEIGCTKTIDKKRFLKMAREMKTDQNVAPAQEEEADCTPEPAAG